MEQIVIYSTTGYYKQRDTQLVNIYICIYLELSCFTKTTNNEIFQWINFVRILTE